MIEKPYEMRVVFDRPKTEIQWYVELHREWFAVDNPMDWCRSAGAFVLYHIFKAIGRNPNVDTIKKAIETAKEIHYVRSEGGYDWGLDCVDYENYLATRDTKHCQCCGQTDVEFVNMADGVEGMPNVGFCEYCLQKALNMITAR